MMFDTKRTFDRIVERYAPSEAAKQAIMKNRLYQHMSNMLAGSQEYMAMERLFEVYHEADFDLIVLDTPPTRHALNFLAAPKKMVNMIEHSILRWFLKPGLFAGKIGLGLFQKSADKILSVFDQLAGFSFLHELAEMISAFTGLLGGFGDRAGAVYDLLRAEEVSFILVTTPERAALKDALYFHDQIGTFGLPLAGFIFNRVFPEYLPTDQSLALLQKELVSLSPPIQASLLANLAHFQTLAERHQRMIASFQAQCGPDFLYAHVPCFESDVHDMGGLAQINQYLFG